MSLSKSSWTHEERWRLRWLRYDPMEYVLSLAASVENTELSSRVIRLSLLLAFWSELSRLKNLLILPERWDIKAVESWVGVRERGLSRVWWLVPVDALERGFRLGKTLTLAKAARMTPRCSLSMSGQSVNGETPCTFFKWMRPPYLTRLRIISRLWNSVLQAKWSGEHPRTSWVLGCAPYRRRSCTMWELPSTTAWKRHGRLISSSLV